MSHGQQNVDRGELLLRGGWRQCTLFTVSKDELQMLPDYLSFDSEREVLLVCTQSCSVCSADFNKDPFVEVMVVTPIKIGGEHSQEKAGQNVRRLVVRMLNGDTADGIKCDINRRAFLSRDALFQFRPHSFHVHQDDVLAFQGWMARYYARAALPNELGRRLRESGFLDAFKGILKSKSGSAVSMHEGVDRLYIYWDAKEALTPGVEELEQGTPYNLHLIIVCLDEAAQEEIERGIANKSVLTRQALEKHDIRMAQPLIATLDNVTLKDILGHTRLNDWDYFSGMAHYASSSRQD